MGNNFEDGLINIFSAAEHTAEEIISKLSEDTEILQVVEEPIISDVSHVNEDQVTE